ncbi:MAG: dihydropteroate synthase-like protein, partial [Sulfolobales archaeon]
MLKILLLTGKLASQLARSIAHEVSKSLGVEIDVDVLDIPVAALMTVKDVLEHLSKKVGEARQYDIIIAPGLLIGDLEIVNRSLGVRCYKGSKYIGDLPLVIKEILKGNVRLSTSKPADSVLELSRKMDYKKVLEDIELRSEKAFNIGSISIPLNPPPFRIMAEVNIEDPIEHVVKESIRMSREGADIIVLGTSADSDNPDMVARAVREVSRHVNKPIGIDSINPREIEAGVGSGAQLVMNISRSYFWVVEKLPRDIAYVLVPESVEDPTAYSRVKSLVRDLEELRSMGVSKVILDPVIPPPNFGALEGLYAVGLAKRHIPSSPVLISSANIVEMIDADSIGINALIASFALEAGASVILVTEDSWKTRGSLLEVVRASLMCSISYARKSPPKDLGIDLLVAKSKEKPVRIPIGFEEDVVVDRYIPPSRLDKERFFVIQLDYEN